MTDDRSRADRERELVAAGLDIYKAREIAAIEAGDSDGDTRPPVADRPDGAPRSDARG